MHKMFFSAITALIMMSGIFLKGIDQPRDREYIVCHGPDLPDDMSDFASDPVFQALHPSPVSVSYALKGGMIKYPTADGKEASAYVVKAKRKSDKWLFVYQEWWGLNEHIKNQADKFYEDLGGKVNVMALDMYDGKVTADPKEAGQIMQGVQEARLENIVRGGLGYAGKKAKVASVGWCFGGSWSLKSALIAGEANIGSVIYYGMPVRDIEKLRTLNSDVLGLFATEKYISKEIIEDFAAKMKEAGKGLNYKIFDGVHGFANASNPKYNKALAEEAYGMALGYLKKQYKI
jgi:carboxymethylenebutenolidase